MLSTGSIDGDKAPLPALRPAGVVMAVVLLLAGCASTPGGGAARGPGATPPDGAVPSPAQGRFEHALELMERKDYREAERELRALAQDHPTLAGPLANLGIVYSETGRVAQAEQVFRRALERNPGNAEVYNQLGVLYRTEGKFGEARRAYEHAISMDPDYANAHLNLGILLDLYLQQPAAALPHYRSYQRLAGKDRQVALWIVDLEHRLQDDGGNREGGDR